MKTWKRVSIHRLIKNISTIIWLIHASFVAYVSSNDLLEETWVAWNGVINALIAIGVILAHIRFYQGIDELQRKIELEAMAIAYGIGIMVYFEYVLLCSTEIISGDAFGGDPLMFFVVAHAIALIIGKKRYA